jgi:hypothetical protein
MRNIRFINLSEIEDFLKTHPNKDMLIAKLDRSITYWRNNVKRSA